MKPTSVLDKYVKPKRDEVGPSEDTIEPDDFGAFGWLRGSHERAVMLELRRKDGSMTAFGYTWLERVDFDPSEGITLKVAGATVKITGRNLNGGTQATARLCSGLVRHRVPWIQEADGTEVMYAPREATVIEQIRVT